jgi:hypothetical protein
MELRDGALTTTTEFAGKLPSPQCEIFVGYFAGAANRVAPDASAYRHRVVASTRISAYAKATVMKFLDNLIGWGDSLHAIHGGNRQPGRAALHSGRHDPRARAQ